MAYRRPSATHGIGDCQLPVADLKDSKPSFKLAIGNRKSTMLWVAESL
jgi:hypothetical protein